MERTIEQILDNIQTSRDELHSKIITLMKKDVESLQVKSLLVIRHNLDTAITAYCLFNKQIKGE